MSVCSPAIVKSVELSTSFLARVSKGILIPVLRLDQTHTMRVDCSEETCFISPLQLTVFEEEAAARRSFWRRANQLEDDISSLEGTIHQDMLTVGSQSQATSIEQQLSSLEENIHSLNQLLSTENQRRHGNKPELANKLPPDITHIMLLMDRQEVEANQSSIPTHKRFVEICEKLLGRTVSEAEKYQERMLELKVGADHGVFHVTAKSHVASKISRVLCPSFTVETWPQFSVVNLECERLEHEISVPGV